MQGRLVVRWECIGQGRLARQSVATSARRQVAITAAIVYCRTRCLSQPVELLSELEHASPPTPSCRRSCCPPARCPTACPAPPLVQALLLVPALRPVLVLRLVQALVLVPVLVPWLVPARMQALAPTQAPWPAQVPARTLAQVPVGVPMRAQAQVPAPTCRSCSRLTTPSLLAGARATHGLPLCPAAAAAASRIAQLPLSILD